jgi:Respiratory nitrate reductase alpha N-terminal
MSHFVDRLTFFKQTKQPFSGDHGITTNEDRSWEDGYRKRWRKLHRLMLVENLRQGRHRHLGNPADRLPEDASRPSQP